MEPFVAVQVKECLELIKKAKGIDCLLLGYFAGNKKSLILVSNNPTAVQAVKESKVIDFNIDKFFAYEPQESRFSFKVTE